MIYLVPDGGLSSSVRALAVLLRAAGRSWSFINLVSQSNTSTLGKVVVHSDPFTDQTRETSLRGWPYTILRPALSPNLQISM